MQENEKKIFAGREKEPQQESEARFEMDEQAESAAAMERADAVVREVKNTKSQMQNIVRHMQQVKTTIRQLRQQLGLDDDGDGGTAGVQDEERVNALKAKIASYKNDLLEMRDDLIAQQTDELKEGVGAQMSVEERKEKATKMVDEMIAAVHDQTTQNE